MIRYTGTFRGRLACLFVSLFLLLALSSVSFQTAIAESSAYDSIAITQAPEETLPAEGGIMDDESSPADDMNVGAPEEDEATGLSPEANTEDTETPEDGTPEMPGMPEPPETPIGIVPPIAGEEDMTVFPPDDYAPSTIELGSGEMPVVMPGEALPLRLPVVLTYMGQPYASNTDAQWVQFVGPEEGAPPERYDQTLAVLVDYVTVSVSAGGLEGLPFAADATPEGAVVADGLNYGFAAIPGLRALEDAAPGNYTIPVTITWKDAAVEAAEQLADGVVQVEIIAPEGISAAVEWGNGIIIYSYNELRAAISQGVYPTIYLGYSDENKGVIKPTSAQGIAVSYNVTIDGNDPLTGYTMRLEDRNASGTRDGLYAGAADLSIAFRNMNITGHNFYGVMYGSDFARVSLRFENVNYTGRQPAHNTGSGSTVSFSNCTVTVTDVGSGAPQEVVEAPVVTFYGNNTVTRTGVTGYSMFWLTGTGDRALNIAPGASVWLDTPEYLIYTDAYNRTSLRVQGDLTLRTAGATGSGTYAAQSIGNVIVADGATLSIEHANAAYPTLRVGSMAVYGTLRMQRTGSAQPLILVAGGSLSFSNAAWIDLSNPGGALVAGSGGASMSISAQVINRYVGGELKTVWNQQNLLNFQVSLSLTAQGGAGASATGLENGGKGASKDAPALAGTALSMMGDTRLVVGRATLSIDPVLSGKRVVSGSAAGGATVVVSEYAYTEGGGWGSLIQSRTTGGGGYSLSGNPFDTPIQRSGSRIYVTASSDEITAHTYRDVTPSGATFLDVPDTLSFVTTRISGRDQLVQRADPNWRIVIEDATAEGFMLYARMLTPLTSTSGDALTHGLVFATPELLQPVTAEDLLIASRDMSAGTDTHTVQWNAEQGLLVWVSAFEGVPNESYGGDIVWTLVSGP